MPKVIQKYTQNAVRPYVRPESDFIIAVDYDPETNEVENVLSVQVYNHQAGNLTSITAVLFDMFHDQLDAMVAAIDWKAAYQTQQLAQNPCAPYLFNRQY